MKSSLIFGIALLVCWRGLAELLSCFSFACRALGKIGPAAKSAVPALIERANDERSPVREAAIQALGEIGLDARSAVPVLRAALKDKDATIRAAAVDALRRVEKTESKK